MQSQPINHKNCPSCGSNLISKNGFQNLPFRIQRYKCKECKYRFESSRRVSFQAKKLMSEYFFKNNH